MLVICHYGVMVILFSEFLLSYLMCTLILCYVLVICCYLTYTRHSDKSAVTRMFWLDSVISCTVFISVMYVWCVNSFLGGIVFLLK